MNEVLQLSTDNPDVVIRELTAADDQAYFDSYNASRTEIAAFDPDASTKHRKIEDTQILMSIIMPASMF